MLEHVVTQLHKNCLRMSFLVKTRRGGQFEKGVGLSEIFVCMVRSLSQKVILIFQMHKTHLKSLVFEILFMGYYSSTFYLFDCKV